MKRALILSLMLGGSMLALPATDANAAVPSASADPQINVRIGQSNRRRSRRVVTTTRITRVGGTRYRETIRVTYLPNGRTRTQVISRQRIGRWGRG